MSTSKLRALARLGWRDLSTHRWRSAFSALAIFAVTAPTTSALLLGRGQLSQSTGPGESLLPTFALIVGVLGLGLVVTLLAAVFLASFHARLRELGHLSAGGGVATDIAGAVIVPALFLGLIGGVPGGVVGLLAGRAAGVAVGAPLPTTAEGALLAAAVSAGIVGA
ncbi:MAG: hypothetical protein LBJ08_02365, partial [Bifidobacteriaceae bacterium]|nr:hypothetical protein [Bifidobacteriaceae bacterium]